MKGEGFLGKIVVVTGAASGIGLALCREFARHGAKIALLDRDEAALEREQERLTHHGADCLGIVCDVSQRDQSSGAIEQVVDRFGGIDVLINNAGITQRGAFAATRIEVFEKVMGVNFFGSLYCTKAAIQALVQRKGLIIVNESVAGFAPLLGRSGYSASKHALHGLFTSLRAEIAGSGAHVMIVCPGFVKTNLQTRALGHDGNVTHHPQSRVGAQQTPEQVAAAIYRGAMKRKPMLVLTPVGKLSYWLNRIAPRTYERVMAQKLKPELEDL